MRRVAGLLAALAVVAVGCGGTPTAPTKPAAVSRETFEKSVPVGATADEVLRALGSPDSTAGSDGSATWTYSGRTADPRTGERDKAADVQLSKGKVLRVDYR